MRLHYRFHSVIINWKIANIINTFRKKAILTTRIFFVDLNYSTTANYSSFHALKN